MTKQAHRQIKATVASNIRTARDAAGLTQRALALQVNGVDTEAVSRWERGVVLPSAENLVVLASVVGRDIAWFYTDHEASTPRQAA